MVGHSLEHVQNIDKFKKEMQRILKTDAYLFFEVPNAKYPLDGAMNNRIDVPHTYYFYNDFFDTWFGAAIRDWKDVFIFNRILSSSILSTTSKRCQWTLPLDSSVGNRDFNYLWCSTYSGS